MLWIEFMVISVSWRWTSFLQLLAMLQRRCPAQRPRRMRNQPARHKVLMDDDDPVDMGIKEYGLLLWNESIQHYIFRQRQSEVPCIVWFAHGMKFTSFVEDGLQMKMMGTLCKASSVPSRDWTPSGCLLR